jgi:hypothetical protein
LHSFIFNTKKPDDESRKQEMRLVQKIGLVFLCRRLLPAKEGEEMTRNELLICILFTLFLAFQTWTHYQELKMVLTLSASDSLAVARALDLVMGGYTLQPEGKNKK